AAEITILGVKPGEWLLGIVTFLLWYATNRLVREGREAAKGQANDTRILQRAYLSVEPGGILPFEDDDSDRVVGEIVIRNAGHLPARDVSCFLDRDISSD